MQKLIVRRIRTGSLFRLCALSLAAGSIPLSSLIGVLATFDLVSLTWNGAAVTGAKGLVVGPFMGIVFTLVGTVVFGTTLALGHWLYSLFRPITLEMDCETSAD